MVKKSKDEQAKKTNGDKPARPEEAPAGTAPPQAASSAARTGTGTEAQLAVLTQYIKDLSFESPGAPQTLQGPGENPQLKVGVNVASTPRGDDIFEVALQIEAHAKSDAGVIYNVELVYGSLFRLRNIPQHLLQPVLFVDCPTILFPFVRRVLADVVRDGGFPPLMLDPIDFARLYTQNMARTEGGEQAQPN
ncbi:MAG TPA: protein-export chaperone SecB [Methyloceanibacter sp.]|nr:protein-export chaperone SecB [Methyloceanibacter sp.]